MSREENSVFSRGENQPDEVKKKIQEISKMQDPLVVKNVEHDPLGLDIPVEVVPLPSRGLVYPPGHPLHNVEEVEINPMTAREEDILTTKAFLKKGTVMTELLKSCLTDKRIDPDDMILGDKSAIMVAIRITGYGADYDAEITCPECNEKYKQEFDLSQLEIKSLEVSPRSEFTNEFEFILPITKKRVTFKLLTSRDEAEVNLLEDKKKKLNVATKESTVTMSLFQAITSIDGVANRAQIKKFVERMPARDSRALRNYMSDISPNIDLTQEVKCVHCDHVTDVTIPMTTAFFWPDVGK